MSCRTLIASSSSCSSFSYIDTHNHTHSHKQAASSIITKTKLCFLVGSTTINCNNRLSFTSTCYDDSTLLLSWKRKRLYVKSDQSSSSSSSVPQTILLVNEDEELLQGFPKRWVIVILCFSAFLLCNMDRVNMSIAILPMSAEYHWNPSTVGLIQSSFFWGYLLTQIAGGIWADTVGGKQVLAFGVVWWSVATILTPVAANLGLPFLLVVRAFMGIGEGVAMPAMNNILSKWIPVAERSRSLALVYSGMYLGSVTGLAFSPFLIHTYGWPSVFYSFGSLGTIWIALWLNKAYSSPLQDPDIHPEEIKLITGNEVPKLPVKTIPWRLILSKPPVWALITCHFCHNWGTFILLTWMPTYYNQVLKFNLTESGLFCVLPWLTMAFAANLGGWIADTLVSKGLSITTVRKIMQSIGFLGPAFFLTQLGHVDSPAMAVLCMACSQVHGMMFSRFPWGYIWLGQSFGTYFRPARKLWIRLTPRLLYEVSLCLPNDEVLLAKICGEAVDGFSSG